MPKRLKILLAVALIVYGLWKILNLSTKVFFVFRTTPLVIILILACFFTAYRLISSARRS